MPHRPTIAIAALTAALTLAFTPAPAGALDTQFTDGMKGWTASKQAELTATVIDADVPGGKACVLRLATVPDKAWKAQFRGRTGQAVASRQVVRLSALMRSPGGATVAGAVQSTKRPFTMLTHKRVKLSPEWKRYEFGGVSLGAADEVQLTFTVGYAAGEVQIADIQFEAGEVKQVRAVPHDKLPAIDARAYDLPGLTEALGDDARSAIREAGKLKIGSKAGAAEPGTDGGEAFMRLRTLGPTEWTYQVQSINPVLTPVKKGDTLLALVRWRAAEPNELIGYASLGVLFELAGPPHERDLMRLMTSSSNDWQTTALPFQASKDYQPRGANLILRVGYGKQAIDVSHVALVNFGQDVAPSSLPATRATYGGSEPDAPWRAAAARRIEAHRMGDLTIRIRDKAGQPVANVQVAAELTRHAFGFGTAFSANSLPNGRHASQAGPYLEEAEKLFNWAVFENAMKWPRIDDPYFQRQVETGLDWMESRGMTVRGHTLIWPSFRRCTKSLIETKDDPEALRARVDAHIRSTAERYEGRVFAWDVINEPFKNRELLDILGDDEMVRWLQIAHEAAPDAQLFVNDFQILSDPSPTAARPKYYLDLVDTLRAKGAPLHGMGMQAHFSGELTPLPLVVERLDQFAAKGLRIHITEFDIATNDEDLQAAYAKDFLTACFSHPAVDAVLVWGFWEGQMFQKSGALYRKDWSRKPVGDVFHELIRDTWRTNAKAVTNASGQASVHGFRGTYRVTVQTPGGEPITRTATLDGDKAELTIDLP